MGHEEEENNSAAGAFEAKGKKSGTFSGGRPEALSSNTREGKKGGGRMFIRIKGRMGPRGESLTKESFLRRCSGGETEKPETRIWQKKGN